MTSLSNKNEIFLLRKQGFVYHTVKMTLLPDGADDGKHTVTCTTAHLQKTNQNQCKIESQT